MASATLCTVPCGFSVLSPLKRHTCMLLTLPSSTMQAMLPHSTSHSTLLQPSLPNFQNLPFPSLPCTCPDALRESPSLSLGLHLMPEATAVRKEEAVFCSSTHPPSFKAEYYKIHTKLQASGQNVCCALYFEKKGVGKQADVARQVLCFVTCHVQIPERA